MKVVQIKILNIIERFRRFFIRRDVVYIYHKPVCWIKFDKDGRLWGASGTYNTIEGEAGWRVMRSRLLNHLFKHAQTATARDNPNKIAVWYLRKFHKTKKNIWTS